MDSISSMQIDNIFDRDSNSLNFEIGQMDDRLFWLIENIKL